MEAKNPDNRVILPLLPTAGIEAFTANYPLVHLLAQPLLQIDPNNVRSLELACLYLSHCELVDGEFHAFSAAIVVRSQPSELARDIRWRDKAYLLCVPGACLPLPPGCPPKDLMEVLADTLMIFPHSM